MLERVINGEVHSFLEEDLIEYRRRDGICAEAWRVGIEFWCLSGLLSYGEFFDTPPDIAQVGRRLIVSEEMDAHALLRSLCPSPASIARVSPFDGGKMNGAYYVALR